MKYLIAGLGNVGIEYQNTRHNIGFTILDTLAKVSNISFTDKRLAYRAEWKFKGRQFILIKPTTFMNLSGRAVNYWLQKEKINLENLLIINDDLALPFGTLRLKPKGGDAGHNGLTSIIDTLGTQNFNRLRFGIDSNFDTGRQVNYVLGSWSAEEEKILPERIDLAIQIIKSFGTVGLQRTMNQFNKK